MKHLNYRVHKAFVLLVSVKYSVILCGSKKYPYPHHRESLEILRGWGVLKAKILKGMYEPKLEFPEGWVSNQKNPLWGEYGFFLEQHIETSFIVSLETVLVFLGQVKIN